MSNPIAEFRGQLEGAMRAEIAKALPKDIDPDRFIRIVVTAVQMDQKLLIADRRSLFASCMKAAQDGLMVDGREAVLNIYNTKIKGQDGREAWIEQVQYLPMVRGLLKAIRNSGEVIGIDAAAVYEKDHFRFLRGDDPKIEHEPYDGIDDPGQVKAAYVIVKLANGEVHREVMYRRDIEKVRAASKSPNGPGWSKWYDQFAIKSVIKRAYKLLPSSSDRLDRIIANDNDAMGFEFTPRQVETMLASLPQAQPQRAIEAPKVGGSTRLDAIIGMRRTADPVPAEQAQQQEPTYQQQELESA